mmetsp:Transcript_23977/g.47862  ORF Transcript_23977/g.47862 Transcript_23977/m.47862 type:complete len:322 (-) Transcript_23977:154-1119(-)
MNNISFASKMMKSTKDQSPSFIGDQQRLQKKPSTPLPAKMQIKFDDADADLPATSSDPVGGCIGISLAEIINTFQNPTNSVSRSNSSSTNNGCGTPRSVVKGFRQKLLCRRIKLLNCSGGAQYSNKNSAPLDQSENMSCLSEDTTFDGEKSLLQRAASWNTLETEPNNSHDENNDHKISTKNEMKCKSTLSSPTKRVQFQYPPITSVRLRPRTQSCEIKKLFFDAEELEQIEDDRLETNAIDDVETLMVGEEWNAIPTCTSSTVTPSLDDNEIGVTSHFIGDHVVLKSPRTPSNSENVYGLNGSKRVVKGVQIMLREKSTC